MAGSLQTRSAPADALIERLPDCPHPEDIDAILSRILAGQPITLFLQDPDFRFVWVANMHPVFQGIAFLGNTDITSGLHEAIYTKYMPIKQEVMRTGTPIHFDEWEVLPDGSNLFLSIAYEPYLFPDGRNGVLCRMIDLSRLGEADLKVQSLSSLLNEKAHELKELDDRFQKAMEGMPLLFYIQNEDLNYVWVKNFVAVYNQDTLSGRTPKDTGAFGAGYEEAMRRKKALLETGQAQKFEVWVDNPNGTRSYLQSTYLPYPMPNGKTGLMGKVLDLTRQKLAEEDLRQANEELTRQNRVIEQQMEEARQMQLAMLPDASLETSLFRFCADMQTCLQVGGDYYDYIRSADGGALIALGDATGHGVKSGIIVSSVKAFFNLLPSSGGPAALLSSISAKLAGMNLKQAYMGLALLEVRPGKAMFAAAGMPPLLVFRKATGKVDVFANGSLFLGTGYPNPYLQESIAWSAGDVAVMLTDGYTEMRDAQGQFISLDALAQLLAGHAAQGCQAVVQAFKDLQATVLQGQPLYDDSTVVAVEFR